MPAGGWGGCMTLAQASQPHGALAEAWLSGLPCCTWSASACGAAGADDGYGHLASWHRTALQLVLLSNRSSEHSHQLSRTAVPKQAFQPQVGV